MAVDHVLSTVISNLDATPPTPNTAGEGGPGYLREVSGFSTAVASSSQDSTYRFVRIPTTAKVKAVRFTSQAQAGGTVDIGVYPPTTGKTAEADLAANAHDQDFFASAVAVTNASAWTDVTNESAVYLPDEINTPLWEAVGLSSDPGGFFDIAATVVGAITTGTGEWALSVQYVD